MKKISLTLKQELGAKIFQQDNYLGKYEEGDAFITFFNKIWPLKSMPSTDNRFKTADQDIYQHMVRNDDWSFEYLIDEYLNLYNGDEKYFIKFVETVVSPEVRGNRDEIIQYVSFINSLLTLEELQLSVKSYFERLPVYKVGEISEETPLPIDIGENVLRIYTKVPAKPKLPFSHLKYVDWDDYGNKTSYDFHFIDKDEIRHKFGRLKIMKKGNDYTPSVIPKSFLKLGKQYCSIGQTAQFYYNLRNFFQNDYQSILLALRDTASFPKIHDEFEGDEIYNTSLLRNLSTERLRRSIRYQLNDIEFEEALSFVYKFTPPYSDKNIPIEFDFNNSEESNDRLKVIIGKNGAGKTQILSSIAKSYSDPYEDSFIPRRPLYGKMFTVSYALFEQFPIPKGDIANNYTYCGLRDGSGKLLTEEKLQSRFLASVENIKKRNLLHDLFTTLNQFINEEQLRTCFAFDIEISHEPEIKANDYFGDEFLNLNRILSSGQSILMYVLTEVVSQIRYNSLILFDEPETHLHPNAISELIKTLSSLLEQFNSFCIIATHSPMIVQEVSADNVYVFEREGNSLSCRKPDIETFGANLTKITNEIFGGRDIEKQYIKSLHRYINEGYSYEEIISKIESIELSIPLNIRLQIKTLLKEKANEES